MYILAKEVYGGKVEADVEWGIFHRTIDEDLCSMLQCPAKPGDGALDARLSIPGSIPSVSCWLL